MAIGIKVKGSKGVISKLETRLKRLKKNRKDIFEKPLNPAVKELRKNLIHDSYNPLKDGTKPDHLFTGRLLANTRYQTTNSGFTGTYDFQYTIQFGYFVEYGLNLEIGSNPQTNVNAKIISDWVSYKVVRTGRHINRGALINKLEEKGSDAYPLVRPVFNNNYDTYLEKVQLKVMRAFQ